MTPPTEVAAPLRIKTAATDTKQTRHEEPRLGDPPQRQGSEQPTRRLRGPEGRRRIRPGPLSVGHSPGEGCHPAADRRLRSDVQQNQQPWTRRRQRELRCLTRPARRSLGGGGSRCIAGMATHVTPMASAATASSVVRPLDARRPAVDDQRPRHCPDAPRHVDQTERAGRARRRERGDQVVGDRKHAAKARPYVSTPSQRAETPARRPRRQRQRRPAGSRSPSSAFTHPGRDERGQRGRSELAGKLRREQRSRRGIRQRPARGELWEKGTEQRRGHAGRDEPDVKEEGSQCFDGSPKVPRPIRQALGRLLDPGAASHFLPSFSEPPR